MKMQMLNYNLRSYCYYALQPITLKLTSVEVAKLERLDCFHWFFSKLRKEYQSKLCTDHLSGEGWHEILEVHFPQMTSAVATKQASVNTLSVWSSTQTFFGLIMQSSSPMNVCWNEWAHSLPFVQKDQPGSAWRSPKSQSTLGYCSIESQS